jgi:hypothetical protein
MMMTKQIHHSITLDMDKNILWERYGVLGPKSSEIIECYHTAFFLMESLSRKCNSLMLEKDQNTIQLETVREEMGIMEDRIPSGLCPEKVITLINI